MSPRAACAILRPAALTRINSKRRADLLIAKLLMVFCDRHRLRTAVPLQSGRSPQIPAAAWMLGVNPSTCVQVALVKIPRAGRGWGARRRTPTAIGIGGINPSAPVQVAAVIVLAARLGVGRACVPRHRDHSRRQRGQEPADPKAHDVFPHLRSRESVGIFILSAKAAFAPCLHQCQSHQSAGYHLLRLKP